MSDRIIDFLVAPNGKSPRNLNDSIRNVKVASLAFREFWLSNDHDDAYEISQEAFADLDYILSELHRQRDARKKSNPSWETSPLALALEAPVGRLIKNVDSNNSTWFKQLGQGQGTFPTGCTPVSLSLTTAINKLKHRDIVAVNFALPSPLGHFLYFLTNAGMGQLDSISEVDVGMFCSSCKVAASYVT